MTKRIVAENNALFTALALERGPAGNRKNAVLEKRIELKKKESNLSDRSFDF